MRGNALRYLGWQVLDRAGPRLAACLVIGGALCLALAMATRGEVAAPPEQRLEIARFFHYQMSLAFVIIIYNGVIVTDRVLGFYRFYLAKPVSPLWFYGQSIALGLLAVMISAAGFLATFSLSVWPSWSWSLMAQSLAVTLLIGGLVLLVSAFSRHDWFWMLITVVVSAALRARFPAAESALGKVVNAVLPPIHLVGPERVRALDAGDWVWLSVWGLGLVALTLAMLRWKPLGED